MFGHFRVLSLDEAFAEHRERIRMHEDYPRDADVDP